MQDLLTELLAVEAVPRITMQIPAGHDPKQRSLVIRHQIETLEDELSEWNLDVPAALDLVDRARGRATDPGLAVARTGTAAVYVAPGFGESVMWPAALAERVAVGTEFYLRDTIALLDTARCYVLTLSRGGVALYRADGLAIEPLEVSGIPADLAEATQHLDPERQLQFHQAGPGRGAGAAVYHGHGIGEGRDLEELRNYLRAVDRGVHEIVAAAPGPMALVGPDELPSEYAAATRLEVAAEVRKNPESLGSEELHGIALDLLTERRDRQVGVVHDKVESLVAVGKASHDLKAVLAAAIDGKVDSLLIDATSRGGEREELVNRAVAETLRHRGRVLPDLDLPPGVEVAAAYRY